MKRKQIPLLLVLILSLALTAMLAIACDGGEVPGEVPSATRYTISFVTPNGVAAPTSVSGDAGSAITIPSAPEYPGHYFIGWYANAEGTGESLTPPTVMPAENRTYYAVYGKYVTLTFLADGETLSAVSGKPGDAVSPVVTDREGYRFDGWYPTAAFDGEAVTLPTVMPDADMTYYAKYTKTRYELSFHANLSGAEGEMPSVFADENGRVTIPACTYLADGYYMLGWTDRADGKLLFNTKGEVTQGYGEGAQLTLTADRTLYARWAQGYLAADGGTDMVYLHQDNVESGIGQAVLTREGKPDKLGFLGIHKTFNTIEFTFYLDESEGGELCGLVYNDRTFRYRDELYGFHVGYDHITDAALGTLLYADGYGNAGFFTTVGAQIKIEAYGQYVFDENYHEYVFVEIDPTTGAVLKDEYGQNKGFYFTVMAGEVDGITPPESSDTDAPLRGYFLTLSDEAGPYYDYANGEMGDTMLELNGYGWARLFRSVNGESVLLAEGAYDATDRVGEWLFTPDAAYAGVEGVSAFRFITTYVQSGNQAVYLFIRYQEAYDGRLAGEGGSEIVMDGYGGMTYTTDAGVFEGNFRTLAVGTSPNLTFYAYGEDGDRVATMYFDVDWTARTFRVNNDEFIIDENGVLIAYRGSSKIVIIPAEIGGVTVTGIGDNVFKAILDNDGNLLYSIEEITIPAGVTHIGALAFQNNYTLRQVTFLGEVPPTVDFATAKDPFRWPAGGFTIVVPEASKAAYVTAFTAAWETAGRDPAELYRIRGSVEVTLLPEFEVSADGTLIAYHRPQGYDPEALVDLILTYGQATHGGADIKITAIAPEVFLGATWLRSIDLGDVKVIGASAFENCTNLEQVTFTKVETVETAAFYGCEKLMSRSGGRLELPCIREIGGNAFAWCNAITYVMTGENLTRIGNNAFSYIKIDADLTTPLFLELTGTTPPEMTSGMAGTDSLSVFAGNSAYRIVIPNIGYAIKCYEAASWNSFCGALYIPSGEEAGTYIGGSNVLTLDGRAILDSSIVWLYTIRNENITFYEFSRETGTYSTIRGTISAGTVTFTYEGTQFTLTRSDGPMSFTSEDKKYTLVVDDPAKLDPEAYMGQLIDATLNGVSVKLLIKNYNFKTISAFEEDGVLYDFTITLAADGSFTYQKTLSPRSYTAADGSVIRIHGTTHGLIDLDLRTLLYRTESGVATVENYTSTYRAVQALGEGRYAVAIQRGNDYYTIILETDGDSFTYHVAEAGRTVTALTAASGDEVLVFQNGEVVSGMALLLDGVYTEVTITRDGDSYLATTVTTPAIAYTVTLDLASGAATIANKT